MHVMVTQRPGESDTESFAGLLLRHRGRTGLTQRDLAARLGTSRRSVQDWESGLSYPTGERLQALIQGLLEAGGLMLGREQVEAHELWAAVLREAPRMHSRLASGWQVQLASCLPTNWCHRRASRRDSPCCSNSCEIGAACCCSTTLRRCSSQVSRRGAIETALPVTAHCCTPSARHGIR